MKNNPRRDQILKTAQKRFVKHGLVKTTIEEIARDLRIGKATVYHYFISKEEIFYEVLSSEVDNYIAELREKLFTNENEFAQKVLGYFEVKENVSEKYPLILQLLTHFFKEQALEKDATLQKELFERESNLFLDFLKSSFNKKNMDPAIAQFFVYQSWGLVFIQKLEPDYRISVQHFASVFLDKLYKLFQV